MCNVMLPMIAEQLGVEASNKEGWLSGLADVVLKKKEENGIELAVAFPAPEGCLPAGEEICTGMAGAAAGRLTFFGFREDVARPECYDAGLEGRMRRIAEAFSPEVVHCFGTEYPHTLALCRAFPRRERILISIQGLCSVYANAYFANLPERVIRSVTLRDILKRDSLTQQRRKFAKRGQMEIEAIKLVKHVAGRTAWDFYYTKEWNPEAVYDTLNETLRPEFYGAVWRQEACEPHSIFLSQGDYPIKGLHYMLLALPAIRERYPDVKVYVAGNSLVRQETIKDRLKISAYGSYLKGLIREHKLKNSVLFLGRLNAAQMRERYLKSHLFVCCSAIENSPNSLGEAMLLGMPCVSADVGGIPSIFTGGEDGILYGGFKTPENGFDNASNLKTGEEKQLENIVKQLADAVIEIWSDRESLQEYCKNARNHAEKNHDRAQNYEKMKEIYARIIGESGE